MKKSTKVKIGIFMGVVIAIGISILSIGLEQGKRFDDSIKKLESEKEVISLEKKLDEAKEIKIEKKFFTFRKHYYVSVNENIVGEVVGRFVPMFGDILELKDMSGNIVKKEYQVKRLGITHTKLFNISFDRLAEIRDANNNVTGYIGEDKIGDFFNLKHTQHFFDKDGKEIGEAKPEHFIFSKDYEIKDDKGNLDYEVDGNIFSILSKSSIIKNDDTDIDEEDVIFYTIIENSIYDSKVSSSSSSSTKKKK